MVLLPIKLLQGSGQRPPALGTHFVVSACQTGVVPYGNTVQEISPNLLHEPSTAMNGARDGGSYESFC